MAEVWVGCSASNYLQHGSNKEDSFTIHEIKWSHPVLPNDSRCNSSSTEVKVLVDRLRPDPCQGGHRKRDSRPHPNTLPTSRSENPLTYPASSHPRTRSAPRWESLLP
ncbi:hypothetical protein AVEN_165398-1 [Araneus ventricosus]|uniref:Uncharacterized protein n=1 Tax=Araneus ventricosus TaxID=182803 RepID=A0A4Y2AT64_ARAVE|nr:hypothetical protein AVEN_165398-1 [Araneus ventricosus]